MHCNFSSTAGFRVLKPAKPKNLTWPNIKNKASEALWGVRGRQSGATFSFSCCSKSQKLRLNGRRGLGHSKIETHLTLWIPTCQKYRKYIAFHEIPRFVRLRAQYHDSVVSVFPDPSPAPRNYSIFVLAKHVRTNFLCDREMRFICLSVVVEGGFVDGAVSSTTLSSTRRFRRRSGFVDGTFVNDGFVDEAVSSMGRFRRRSGFVDDTFVDDSFVDEAVSSTGRFRRRVGFVGGWASGADPCPLDIVPRPTPRFPGPGPISLQFPGPWPPESFDGETRPRPRADSSPAPTARLSTQQRSLNPTHQTRPRQEHFNTVPNLFKK